MKTRENRRVAQKEFLRMKGRQRERKRMCECVCRWGGGGRMGGGGRVAYAHMMDILSTTHVQTVIH